MKQVITNFHNRTLLSRWLLDIHSTLMTSIISTVSLTALNLMLCYYAVSDREKLKKCFHRMLQIGTGISDEDRYYPAVVRYVPHILSASDSPYRILN